MKRLNNIELLRILSMFMVLVLHYLSNSGLLFFNKNFGIMPSIVWLFESLSFVAVNCYVLISGYFLINSEFKIKKLLKIFIELSFYSVLIYCLMLLSGEIDFTLINFLKSLFPISLSNYWFATNYVILYILSPYLNKLVHALSEKEYKKLLILIFLIFSLWATIIPNTQTINYGGSYSISWFICLYLIAGYIRLHYKKEYNKYLYLGIYIVFSIVNCICFFIIPDNNFIRNDFLYNYHSITVLLSSISLFIYFSKIKINSNLFNKIISFIAPTTFGIYLIHENPNIRAFLWNKILKNYSPFIISSKISMLNPISSILVLVSYIILIPLVLLICLSLIDKLREYIFKFFERYKIERKNKL